MVISVTNIIIIKYPDTNTTTTTTTIMSSVVRYVSSLNKFFDYLGICGKKNLTMCIGYRITNPLDVQRNLKFSIVMDYYDSSELIAFIESTPRELIPYFVFNMDFNCFCMLSKGIVAKYNNINKLDTIVFDSSTFKFLSNIKMIALFYYLILEQGGSIYIESNSPMNIGYIILNQKVLLDLVPGYAKDGFCCQTGHILSSGVESSLSAKSCAMISSCIITREKIYQQNIEFFTKWFYGSSVELLDNDDSSYPLINERYPVTKYYKITKELPHDEILTVISHNAKEYDTGLSLRNTTIVRMGI